MEDIAKKHQSSTSTVTINVLDINDNSPIFTKKDYRATIVEDAPKNTLVISVSATDTDSFALGTDGIRYTMTGNGHEK